MNVSAAAAWSADLGEAMINKRVSIYLLAGLLPVAALAEGRVVLSANAEQPAIEQHASIAANAYHAHSPKEVEAALDRGIAVGKPTIISDDGTRNSAGDFGTPPGVLRDNLGRVKARNDRADRPLAHYEHLSIPLTNRGEAGKPIGRVEDFPHPARRALAALRGAGSRLEPGGVLGVRGDTFTWNGAPVMLAGFSFYGAALATGVDIDGYLAVLADHGVNLTRLFLVDQWTALGWKRRGEPCDHVGLVPFAGTFCNRDYDLETLNDAYFDRLQRFVAAAARLGIVVQLSLFERNGLSSKIDGVGAWRGSPYNAANNVNDILTLEPGSVYPAFTAMPPAAIGRFNQALIERTVRAVAGSGNVIFEIMNEPLGAWPNQAAWHHWVASVVHDARDRDAERR